MKKIYSNTTKIVLFGAILIGGLLCPNNVVAQYYGQSDNSPVVVVDKKIGFGGDRNYYDNVASGVKVFRENDEITFKIVVENRGNVNLENLVVRDTLPRYLGLLLYPGTLNKDLNLIETRISNLNPGETKEFLVVARIKDLPVGTNDKLELTNRVCVVNTGVGDCDNAKYFVAYKNVPATGTNDLVIKTVIVLTLSLMALGLRKKARGF